MRKRNVLLGILSITTVSLCACGGDIENVMENAEEAITIVATEQENVDTEENTKDIATEETTVKVTEIVHTKDETESSTESETTTEKKTDTLKETEKHTTRTEVSSNSTETKVEKGTTVDTDNSVTTLEVVNKVISQIITNDMTELQKVKAIHDYMVMNLDYDKESYYSGVYPKSCYTVEGVLTGKYAICEGYARTFKALCNATGIECDYVSGTGKRQAHAWNQVKINGKWYNVDVTWDDPLKIEGESFDDHSHNRYNYFLVSDEVMYTDHSTKEAKHVCTDSLYFEVLKMGIPWCDYVYVETQEEFKKAVAEKVEKNATEMRFFIKAGIFNEDPLFGQWDMSKMVDKAILACNVYDDYDIIYSGGYQTDEFGVFRYVAKINLENGVYTKFQPITTVDEAEAEILRFCENFTEDTECKLYVTNELAETSFISESVERWLFYEKDILVSETGSRNYSDNVRIVLIYLNRAPEDYQYIERAHSYEEVEAYIIAMLERGDTRCSIDLYYTNIPLDGEKEACFEIEDGFASEMEEKYGLVGVTDPNNSGEVSVRLYFRKI